MELDDLFSVRNMFWLGNYEAALDEAQQVVPSNDRESIDRDVFVYRCYIAQGKASKVMEVVGDSASTDVLAVKLFAQYLSQPASSDAVVETFQQWLSDETTRDNATLQLMAGLVFFKQGDTEAALKAVQFPNNLEHLALRVQIALSLNRVDMATEELQKMQQIDDDSTLTQLASAWVYLATSGQKYQEAAYIFQEQIDKTVSSGFLLNSLGVAHMQLKKFEDAEKYLQEALAKNPADADALANLVSCSANLNRPSAKINQLMDQLKKAAPEHPLVAQAAACEEAFAKFKPN